MLIGGRREPGGSGCVVGPRDAVALGPGAIAIGHRATACCRGAMSLRIPPERDVAAVPTRVPLERAVADAGGRARALT